MQPTYTPTWVEWSITAAAFSGFCLLYLLFSKVFPIVSIWEVRHADERHAPAEARPAESFGGPVAGREALA